MFIRTGRATAALVAAGKGEVKVLDVRQIALADPLQPASMQPYHVFESKKGAAAEQRVEKLVQRVAEVADDAIASLLAAYREKKIEPTHAVLVVGSLIDPKTLKNEHIQWHALEGKLFRDVVQAAFERRKIPVSLLISKTIYQHAAAAMKLPEGDLKLKVKELGGGASPWRAQEKASSLAGWLGCSKGAIAL